MSNSSTNNDSSISWWKIVIEDNRIINVCIIAPSLWIKEFVQVQFEKIIGQIQSSSLNPEGEIFIIFIVITVLLALMRKKVGGRRTKTDGTNVTSDRNKNSQSQEEEDKNKSMENHHNKENETEIVKSPSSISNSSSKHTSSTFKTGKGISHLHNKKNRILKKQEHNIKIIGPKAPQQLTYLVTAPASESIPLLSATTEYRSIYRQLVLDVNAMTLSQRKPVNTNKRYVSGEKNVQSDNSGSGSGDGTIRSSSSQKSSSNTTVQNSIPSKHEKSSGDETSAVHESNKTIKSQATTPSTKATSPINANSNPNKILHTKISQQEEEGEPMEFRPPKKENVIPLTAIANTTTATTTSTATRNRGTLRITIDQGLVKDFHNYHPSATEIPNREENEDGKANNNNNNNTVPIFAMNRALNSNEVTIENWRYHQRISRRMPIHPNSQQIINPIDNTRIDDFESDYDHETVTSRTSYSSYLNDFIIANYQHHNPQTRSGLDQDWLLGEEEYTIQNGDIMSGFSVGNKVHAGHGGGISGGDSGDNDASSHSSNLSVGSDSKSAMSPKKKTKKRSADGRGSSSTKEERNKKLFTEEYTFQSETEAASFQTICLGLRVVGREVWNMYSALESVHFLSKACDVSEMTNAMIDNEKEDSPDEASNNPADNDANEEEEEDEEENGAEGPPPTSQCIGVTLDDVHRCLGQMEFISSTISKIQSEQAATSSISLSADFNPETTNSNNFPTSADIMEDLEQTDTSDSQKEKRIVLGFLDFLRLFIPRVLPGTPYSSPNCSTQSSMDSNHNHGDGIEAHQARVQQLVEMQKRVAEASLRVCSYVNACKLVNQGWSLSSPSTLTGMQKRNAFDSDSANIEHDFDASNEYYEGTVGKDVDCNIPNDILSQAYSLIGCQMIQLPSQKQGNSRQKKRPTRFSKMDPVMALPTLQKIVESNPHMEFFVASFFHKGPNIATVLLFVRSIPREVDSELDKVLNDYIDGDSEIRNEILGLAIQLGPKPKLSFLTAAAMQLKSLTLRHNRDGTRNESYKLVNERMSFSPISLSKHMKTRHFGGCLNEDKEKAMINYLALSISVDDSLTYPLKILHQHVQKNKAQNPNVVDYTFVMRDWNEKNAIHRALGTVRFVHIDPKTAIPFDPASYHEGDDESNTVPAEDLVINEDNDSALAADEADENERYREAVESLKEILDGITVPVRVAKMFNDEASILSTASTSLVQKEDMHDIQVLQNMNDNDLRLHYIASESNLRDSAIRIVHSAAWRGITFPIDIRTCRIELESGQFFMKGVDLKKNPVLYFRNMCLGPWRQDVEASIFAILHRLDIAITEQRCRQRENFKFTVVVWMGKPLDSTVEDTTSEQGELEETVEEENEAGTNSTNEGDGEVNEDDNEDKDEKEGDKANGKRTNSDNSKIDSTEEYFIHTNFQFVKQLIDLVSRHYPERLGTALIVPEGGWERILGTHGLRRWLNSSRTRSKVKILDSAEELKNYISVNELVTPFGGKAPVPPESI